MSRFDAKSLVNARVDAALKAAGHSQLMTNAAKREAASWVRSRVALAERRRGLISGWGIVWTDAGHGTVELKPIEVPVAGAGEVTVETAFSVVSPGTERAYYLRLPNARPHIPHRPGYSLAGRVIAAGRDTGFRVGEPVAVTGQPHASAVTAESSRVYHLPVGSDLAAAATIMLGVISGQGVRLAGVVPGEDVCVLGAGAIGLLAERIARARGAGSTTVLARSARREKLVLGSGAGAFRRVVDATHEGTRWPLVFEVTGSPEAVASAIELTADGGRVILLGSTRGQSSHVPVDVLRARGIELIGAHVNTLALEEAASGRAEQHEVGENYLADLATGAVSVDDMTARRLDPREAEIFYRSLAADRDIPAAAWEWGLLPDAERATKSSLVRLPDITGRGKDPMRRLAAPHRGRAKIRAVVEPGSPYDGAVGDCRFGMVGCGDIAVLNGSGVAQAPNTSMVACFDPDRALADDLASAHGAEVTESYAALLDRSDVDAVFLSVPHHLHAPLALSAIEAGKHVVVEKPPANALSGAVQMVEAAEAAGVALSVCFPQRYQPDVVVARHLIAEGAIGEVAGVTAELLMDRSPAYRLSGFSGRAMSDWRSSREKAGGGVLIMNLSHYVDLLHHLTGLVVTDVTAYGSGSIAGIEDTIMVNGRLSNGGLLSVTGSVEVRGSSFTQVRVWGPHGQVATEHDPRFYTLRSVDGLRTTYWQKMGKAAPVNIRGLFVSRFATAVATGSPLDIPARDTLQAQAFIEAAYRAADGNTSVSPQVLLNEASA